MNKRFGDEPLLQAALLYNRTVTLVSIMKKTSTSVVGECPRQLKNKVFGFAAYAYKLSTQRTDKLDDQTILEE